MKIKDIVNRDIVNLTNCDQEPIHIPGSIQPHGFLLGVTQQFTVVFCSENVTDFIGITPAQILAKNIQELFGATVANAIENYIKQHTGSVTSPLVISLGNKYFNCVVNKSNHTWVAEFEPTLNSVPQVAAVFDQTVQFVKYMQQSQSLQQLCAKVVEEIRTLTGYDRVMVYRFDKDYNGEVYAESKREDIESFFGLHYPHTDIPVQARQLYIKNLLRLIVDVNYTPVPLLTVDNGENNNLDLSLSTLRSVSPIHVQYLQNMGVGGTLTISLLHNGKLWGLIACHHYSYKYIDHYTRINAQLQGHFLTSQIDIRQAAEEYAVSEGVNASLQNLLNFEFVPTRESLEVIVKTPELLNLCNACGVAILLDGVIYKNGQTPRDEDIHNITQWALQNNPLQIYSTSKLSSEFDKVQDCAAASGIIFCGLSSLTQASIIWFNPETGEEVSWGGDPDKAIIKDENGLHPRKSFETWKLVIKCQARPWLKPEVTAAANFAYALQKHITLLLLAEESERQRQLSEKLKETNAELENINWISTHDLQEPLRKIQMFSSKLLAKYKNTPNEDSITIQKMNESARRMRKLIEDLMAYAKVRQSQEGYQPIDLNNMLEDIKDELKDDTTQLNAIINVPTGLPVINGIPVLARELFINLFRNSLKFTQAGIAPVITLEYDNNATLAMEPGKVFYLITVNDNGIGFENEFSENIFKIFARLGPAETFSGSGIGLALCKKIMQLHHGFITANGEPNEGASFMLYFPKQA